MGNDEQLLNIAKAGLFISSYSKENEEILLIILLDLEDALDKGRMLLESSEIRKEIDEKMDILRNKIRKLLDSMDKGKAKNILESRGESLKRQFSIT